jgi:signal transduction histidine kinase
MLRENPPLILVVDDDPENFEVIEILLFKENHKLIYAGNASEALNSLENALPDVILLDVMMPEMDGLELCQHIKGNWEWKHIPIIMVTSLNAKEDLARCLDAGADDFIGKPVNGLELRARVRSMLRIKHQYDSLKSALQLREDMSNMVVHDLRNPVASIIMACEVMRLYDLPEKPQKKLEQILLAGNRLQSLIDTLLMMAKLDSGKMLLSFTEVDICDLAQKVVSDFEAMANQRQIKLVSELPTGSKFFSLDAVLFRRIFDNLLSNAINFSPPHSQVTLKLFYPHQLSHSESLSPSSESPIFTPNVCIQFIDECPRVSEELQQRIFEKYDMGSPMQGVTQTALALAFCKIVIEAHNGRFSVENRQPNGAIFTVEI